MEDNFEVRKNIAILTGSFSNAQMAKRYLEKPVEMDVEEQDFIVDQMNKNQFIDYGNKESRKKYSIGKKKNKTFKK